MITANDPVLVGRRKELDWLTVSLLPWRTSDPVYVTGKSGIGKTLLINHWYENVRTTGEAVWLDFSASDHAEEDLESVIVRLKAGDFTYRDKLHIILDGLDLWNDEKIQRTLARLYNYKVVEAVVIIRQILPKSANRDSLELKELQEEESVELLNSLLKDPLEPFILSGSFKTTGGNPQAIVALARMMNQSFSNSEWIASGAIYTMSNQIVLPEKEVSRIILPIVKDTSKKIITSLQRHPGDIFQVSPFEFEHILAELLRDMGYEIEITQQTRDGGKDILAYKHTPIGKLLFLVEAKRYRQDRKVGVDLVRSLYGTLMDHKANSAMLVTTSSFTADARDFQKKYQYLLSLKEYEDIVSWILKYGKVKSPSE